LSIGFGPGVVKRANCLIENLTLAASLPHVIISPAPAPCRGREGWAVMRSRHSRRQWRRIPAPRDQTAPGPRPHQILDEFVAATGYHRKYALRLLNHVPDPPP